MCSRPLAFCQSDKQKCAFWNLTKYAADRFREVLLLTEKDLRKLNRYQLLELLVMQTERADKLQIRLEEAQKQLQDRNDQNLKISSLGSIAEASLQLQGVFQAAQGAADMYIAAAKKHAEEIEEAAHKKAAEILIQAQAQARRIKGE